MQKALGLIECVGYTSAMAAADAALKAADVMFLGCETTIGARQKASVTVKIGGGVSAVYAAVAAGETAAAAICEVISVHVMPRPHEQTDKVIFTAETTEALQEKEVGLQSKTISKPSKKRKK